MIFCLCTRIARIPRAMLGVGGASALAFFFLSDVLALSADFVHVLMSIWLPWLLYAVYGALLGIQDGRSIEICNSFELLVRRVEGKVLHDPNFFNAKEKQGVCVCACVVDHEVQVCLYVCLFVGFSEASVFIYGCDWLVHSGRHAHRGGCFLPQAREGLRQLCI